MVPIGLGMVLSWSNGKRLIDQTWYEPGGVVQMALILVIFNYISPMMVAFNPFVILNRYFLGRGAYSQQRLNKLWEVRSPTDRRLAAT